MRIQNKKCSSLLIVLFISITLITVATRASGNSGIIGGGLGGFNIGFHWFDISELNSELSSGSSGFTTFDNRDVTFGGMGYGIFNKIVLGGEGQSFEQKKSTSNYYQHLSGGYGLFNVGYLLLYKSGLILYPTIGFGGGGFDLRLTEKSTLSFSDIINDPKRESYLSTGAYIITMGMALDYLFPLAKEENSVGGILIGIKLGYAYSFSDSEWKMGDLTITGPKIGMKGFFLRFAIGGGGIAY